MSKIFIGMIAALMIVACHIPYEDSIENNDTDDTHTRVEIGANTISKVKQATYAIRPNGVGKGSFGSGILIDDNLLVTAWHVIASAYKEVPEEDWGTVELYVQKTTRANATKARLIKYDFENDIAILKTSDTACPCVRVRSKPILDDDVLYSSYHLSGVARPIFLRGYLVAQDFTYISTSIPVHFGASGGGLLIRSGDEFVLIGIIRSMPVNNGHILNYLSISTPIEFVKRLLAEE